MRLCIFNNNETVVCIKKDNNITIGYKYVIISRKFSYISIRNDLNQISEYYFVNFMNLQKYNMLHRKDKLNKIMK